MRRVTTCGDKDSDGHQGRQGLDSGLQVPPALCVLGDLRCHQPHLWGPQVSPTPIFQDLKCHHPSLGTSGVTNLILEDLKCHQLHPWGPQVPPTPPLGTSGVTNSHS